MNDFHASFHNQSSSFNQRSRSLTLQHACRNFRCIRDFLPTFLRKKKRWPKTKGFTLNENDKILAPATATRSWRSCTASIEIADDSVFRLCSEWSPFRASYGYLDWWTGDFYKANHKQQWGIPQSASSPREPMFGQTRSCFRLPKPHEEDFPNRMSQQQKRSSYRKKKRVSASNKWNCHCMHKHTCFPPCPPLCSMGHHKLVSSERRNAKCVHRGWKCDTQHLCTFVGISQKPSQLQHLALWCRSTIPAMRTGKCSSKHSSEGDRTAQLRDSEIRQTAARHSALPPSWPRSEDTWSKDPKESLQLASGLKF